MKRVIVIAGLLVMAGVVPAFAQRVEVGGFVGWSRVRFAEKAHGFSGTGRNGSAAV